MNTRRTLLRSLLAAPLLLAVTAVAGDFPKGSPKFKTSFKKAMAEAKEANKPAVVVFSASWCGPCQTMKKSVYPSDEIKALHDKFVWAYLDTDEKDNAKVAEEFNVRGIPHIQFLSPDGKPIDKQIGSSSPEAFAATLEKVLEKSGAAKEADQAEKTR